MKFQSINWIVEGALVAYTSCPVQVPGAAVFSSWRQSPGFSSWELCHVSWETLLCVDVLTLGAACWQLLPGFRNFRDLWAPEVLCQYQPIILHTCKFHSNEKGDKTRSWNQVWDSDRFGPIRVLCGATDSDCRGLGVTAVRSNRSFKNTFKKHLLSGFWKRSSFSKQTPWKEVTPVNWKSFQLMTSWCCWEWEQSCHQGKRWRLKSLKYYL